MTKPKVERPAGIDEAVALYKSQEAFADELDVSRQAVHQWVTKGYVPLERVRPIAEMTGVPARRLCNPKIASMFPELEQ